jgi:hypothetical protein
MILRRRHRDRPFTVINNEPLQRPDLSLGAKGLLCLLMSYPENWDINLDDLTAASADGKHATRTAITELMKAGYVTREMRRESGRFVAEYLVDDEVMIEQNAAKTHQTVTVKNAEKATTKATEKTDRVRKSDAAKNSHRVRFSASENRTQENNKYKLTPEGDLGAATENENFDFEKNETEKPPPKKQIVTLEFKPKMAEQNGSTETAEKPQELFWRTDTLATLSAFDQFFEIEKAWIKWREYQSAAHRNDYPYPASEVEALKKLHRGANGNAERASEIINQNIGDGYKALIIPTAKAQKNGNGNANRTTTDRPTGSDSRIERNVADTLDWLRSSAPCV